MFGYAKIGSHRTASSSIQSLYFRTFWRIAHNPCVRARLEMRIDPESVSCGDNRKNPAHSIAHSYAKGAGA